MKITPLERRFIFSSTSSEVVLDDPNPHFTPQEVLYHYVGIYPELASGTIVGPTIENDTQLYKFQSGKVGVKG